MRTCAFDRVITAQNGCQRIMAFDQAIIVNDTGDLAIQREYTAVDGFGRQQVFACMLYD